MSGEKEIVNTSGLTCLLCFEAFNDGDIVLVLDCKRDGRLVGVGHVVCGDCAGNWDAHLAAAATAPVTYNGWVTFAVPDQQTGRLIMTEEQAVEYRDLLDNIDRLQRLEPSTLRTAEILQLKERAAQMGTVVEGPEEAAVVIARMTTDTGLIRVNGIPLTARRAPVASKVLCPACRSDVESCTEAVAQNYKNGKTSVDAIVVE